jgi:hypothetical protein
MGWPVTLVEASRGHKTGLKEGKLVRPAEKWGHFPLKNGKSAPRAQCANFGNHLETILAQWPALSGNIHTFFPGRRYS